MRVLITGGAGFIGSHLARKLNRGGHEVSIYDNFSPQVHGNKRSLPADLRKNIKLFPHDIRDADKLVKALKETEVVVHLAAETGTGQSMYELARYESINIGGTALLLECCVNHRPRKLEKVIVASSRAVYGEGRYQCQRHGVVYPEMRLERDLANGSFEPRCPKCGGFCDAMSTPEDTPCRPGSFYGLTKQVQEQMVMMFTRHLGIRAFALRFQNVYGPGQSLKNPYTGILAIFANLARQGREINVFEDGNESRDFVFIDDAVEALSRCVTAKTLGQVVLNVGSGEQTSVNEVVKSIAAHFESDSIVRVSGDFRLGDIRHNVADIARAKAILKFRPQWGFRAGLKKFLAWVVEQPREAGAYEESLREMRAKGLMGRGALAHGLNERGRKNGSMLRS